MSQEGSTSIENKGVAANFAEPHVVGLSGRQVQSNIFNFSPATKDFIAGGVAGGASVIGGAPLDILRIRMQQANSARVSLSEGIRRIVATEGVRTLFRGSASPLASIALQNAVVFQAYGMSERALKSSESIFQIQNANAPSTSSTIFIAGCLAGLAQSFVICPVDVLKIRLQVAGAALSHGPLLVSRNIFMKEGPRGLFRGLPITLIRDTPSHGVYFWVYDVCQRRLTPKNKTATGMNEGLANFTAGGIAGIVSWWSVYPFDVIKSRIQACHGPPRSWMTVASECVRNEGWRALFRGIEATTLRAFFVNGIIFSVYEASMSVLDSV